MAIGAAVASVGGSLYNARSQRKAGDKAADATRDASLAGIAEQRAAREDFNRFTAPYRGFGTSAINPLHELVSQDAPDQIDRGGLPGFISPTEDDIFSEADFNNPIIDFLSKEGFRKINEAGAGGGRNVDRDLSEFQAGLLSTVAPQLQQQRFNQTLDVSNAQRTIRGTELAEKAGIRADAVNENQARINNLLQIVSGGQNAAVGAGNAGLSTANNINSNLTNIGIGKANRATNRDNTSTNNLSNILQAGGFIADQAGLFDAPPKIDPRTAGFINR